MPSQAPILSLAEASRQIRSRQLSPVELTRECLRRIDELNPTLHAFITVTAESALVEAAEAEAEISAGRWRGPLHGIPIALKDLIDTAGVRTTAASNHFRNRVPAEDAEVVRCLKQSGAVLLGKLNLHEFAFGGSGVISAFGPARNPWAPERITGGSSSGAGAAVAAGLCLGAVGSDTAGSVRIPAALCGIVGHRPSARLISTAGVIPLCWSFDTLGPMTRTIEDAALLMDGMSGHAQGLAAQLETSLQPLRIGVPRTHFYEDLEAGVSDAVGSALEALRTLGTEVREVELRVYTDRTIANAEIYAYHEPMATGHPELYQEATLDRVRNCAGISATSYVLAVRELERYRRESLNVFCHVAVLVTPTTPAVAPTFAELPGEHLREFETRRLLRNTSPFSMLFWPSISVPCGLTAQRLPVGLQITGKPGEDALVLKVARMVEKN